MAQVQRAASSGVANLQAPDAPMVPRIAGSNANAPSMITGAKAAYMILQK